MRQWRRILVGAVTYVIVGAFTPPAIAHGFGQRYDLPIPLSFYVWGAGATVALSFVGFALFLRNGQGRRYDFKLRLNERLVSWMMLTARVVGLSLFALVIVAGLYGNQDPIRNIAPVMVWVIAWVGLAFVSLCLGNIWAPINPWNTAFALAETAYARWRTGTVLGAQHRYPRRLGVWPAFLLLIVFAWIELIWSGKNVPAQLSTTLIVYSAITWTGMFVFGREAWLKGGEVFNLVFGIFARFAPMAKAREAPVVGLRLPGAGLLEDSPVAISMVALVIALLATVTFDGFLETPLWAQVDVATFEAASEFDSLSWTLLGLREDQTLQLVRTFGLVGCISLFLIAYAAVCWLTAIASGDRKGSVGSIARQFVLTLVPIALAYHVAHYFSLLFISGQYAIPLISDPLGRGWNLFGTADYRVDISVITPRLQWTVAVVAVVLGHVIAVYLSHVTALRFFRSRRAALLSQAPMVLLMVGYTMVSLWILSQPIVEATRG